MADLRMREASKTYPNGVHALQRIDLAIPPGMYGLLGPNGAGKSTLMRTIATLQEPDEGEIHLGRTIARQKDEVRRTLGYLPVAPDLEDVRFSVMSGHYGGGATAHS